MSKNNLKPKRKFTIIDGIIIFVLVVGIAAVGNKFKKAQVNTPFVAKSDKIEISYFVEEIPESAATSIEIGDSVRESIQNANFGKVSDKVVDQSISWSRDVDGNYVPSTKEGYASLYITMEADGIIGKNGVTIDKSIYYIGQTLTIYAGNSMLQNGRIAEIKKVE
ncbi:DUF4330 domain-containing protein [Tissierella pigra]|uniref:DUF4330 domain-containing protein n=1 Tax=Tissierella pigra TaxID=2607614 RepID=A0A6N7XWL6_9FIRM|nr:DUF4330 domain-containing protein [Tissierella pigra]MBU5427397.1 DUF4330 domain-containing protein [Tissierella pigra]MSU00944.1 DUF4330 domain-containing protein [Tissierella pigra]